MKVRRIIWLVFAVAIAMAAAAPLSASTPVSGQSGVELATRGARFDASGTTRWTGLDEDDDRQRRGRRARRDDDDDSDSDSDSDRDRRKVRRGLPFPDRDRNIPRRDSRRGGFDLEAIAYNNGQSDGYEKGLEDSRNQRTYDPARHRWYRSADRGYDGLLGSRDRYRDVYRDGFTDGYDAGYRDGGGGRRGTRWPIQLPWPF